MEVWNIVRLKAQLDSMREHKRTTVEEHVIYVLNPFIASLGYDIYDISQVDVQVTKGRVIVRPVPNVNVVFSVTSSTPSNAKVFIYLDTKKYQMKVYMYAMHKWELVDVVEVGDVTEPNSSVYSSVIRVIAQDAFQIMYAEREERMFTERILRSKLESGTMHNEFTVAAVKRLFDRPTEAFLSAIAEVLAQDYSTDDSNELYGYLQPMQTQGIRSIVSEYMKDMPMTADKPEPTVHPVQHQPAYCEPAPAYVEPTPAYVEPVAPPVEEVVPSEPVAEIPPVAIVEVEAENEQDKEKNDTPMQDLLNAVNNTKVVEPIEQTVKSELSMTDVLNKKPAGNNIADMFGTEEKVRKVPRTKPL